MRFFRRDTPASSETREVDGLGLVLFERSAKARHVVITVRPFKGIRVAVPRGVSFDRADKFVRTKARWAIRHLERMKEVERAQMEFAESCAPVNRKKASRELAERLERLSAEHGLPYNRLSIRCQRTRWGSCSAKNNISLNVKLVALPAELMDYVIVHELVHTRIMNHSRAFWAELERRLPGSKAMDARLKKYRLAVV